MRLFDLLDRYQTVLAGVEEALSHLRTAMGLMERVQALLDRRVVGIRYALGIEGRLESRLSAPESSPADEEAPEEREEQMGSYLETSEEGKTGGLAIGDFEVIEEEGEEEIAV